MRDRDKRFRNLTRANATAQYAVPVGIPSGLRFPLAFGMTLGGPAGGRKVRAVRCTSTARSIRAREVSATCPSTPAVPRPALRCVTCRTLISVFDQLRSIIFCRFLTVARSPSFDALKILRRSRRTLLLVHGATRSCPSRGLVLRSVHSESRHRNIEKLSSRPTCPSVPVVTVRSSFKGSPAHVSLLSQPGTRPGIRPVIREPSGWRTGD